jgi:hypothetical protein
MHRAKQRGAIKKALRFFVMPFLLNSVFPRILFCDMECAVKEGDPNDIFSLIYVVFEFFHKKARQNF